MWQGLQDQFKAGAGRAGTNYINQDNMLQALRAMLLGNATASNVGARRSAMYSAGNDPSMAAYGGLHSLIAGQGQASGAMSSAVYQRLAERQRLLDQIRLMKMQAKMQQGNPVMGALGGLAGSFLGPIGYGIGSRWGSGNSGGGDYLNEIK